MNRFNLLETRRLQTLRTLRHRQSIPVDCLYLTISPLNFHIGTRQGPILAFLFFVVQFLIIKNSHAYLEMIRPQHNQCISCHVSPGGDGPLTSYGRAMSSEVISTWSFDGESKPLLGLIPENPSLHVGGNFRTLTSVEKNRKLYSARSGVMQSDFEVTWQEKPWAIDISYGYIQAAFSPTGNEEWQSRRHYLLYSYQNDQGFLRIGKFYPQYGLMLDDHTSLNRSRLGFGPNRESYNLELSWLKPLYTLVLTAKGESPGKAHFDQDLGGALALRWHLWSGRELGISVISTRSQLNSLTAMGLHNFWTFSPKWHGLLQWDLIQEDQKTLFITRNGHTFIGRVEYEIFQGLSLSMGYEMSYTDVFSPASLEEYYRTSIRWFPRSHWEILTIYKWKRNPGVNSNFSEIGSWMVHFYL